MGLDEMYQEGWEQGTADGEDMLRGTIEHGMHTAAQGALHDVYNSVLCDHGFILKHGGMQHMSGVWACLLHTGICPDLFYAIGEEMERIRPVIYR